MSAWRKLFDCTSAVDWHARAAVGAAAWLAGACLLRPGWGVVPLLFAPLVVVPLALALLPTAGSRPSEAKFRQAAATLQLPAALLLVAAAAHEPGLLAALLTLPWFLCTVLLAVVGLLRLQARPAETADWCVSVGLLYIAVGGAWLVLSALGARPLNLQTEIVRATATHFHYAGLAIPLLAGLMASALRTRLARATAVCVAAGVPLVAVGITLSAFGVRQPELIAAWFLAGTGVVLAVLQLALAARTRGLAAVLLGVSSMALLAGMALAMLYGLGEALRPAWLDIPLMLKTHGILNAFGFALPGLLAWNLGVAISPARARGGSEPDVSGLKGSVS